MFPLSIIANLRNYRLKRFNAQHVMLITDFYDRSYEEGWGVEGVSDMEL
jgi:hypothetical protein